MSILISANQLSKGFGGRPLFKGLTFSIEDGERIGLIGPNGAGKSTLLRILAGKEGVDSGQLSFKKGFRAAFLEQVPAFTRGATVLETLMEGARAVAGGLAGGLEEAADSWEELAWANEIMAKLGLTGESGVGEITPVESLSGGWKKRVALARELARRPDLLLLDEPTNHLDIESILWLEEFLAQASFATLTITHDRAFLQRISNRIIELDRANPNGLLSIRGTYSDYLETKTQLMEAQQRQEQTLKNTLRRETEWLRQGAKARTTKQQARIQRAESLGEEVSELEFRNRARSARIEFQASEKAPKKLIEIQGLAKSYPGKKLFEKLDLMVTPASRIGILGRNGSGKSTLIRIITGEEVADRGEVFRSEQLKIAYFNQNRESLDPMKSLIKTLCPTGDQVHFQGRSVHIRSYLDRFLFQPEQMEMAVGKLSGGEQSRILIAKLMLTEANLLILDEPTNDLDLQTLNVLQDCLAEFQGAILLISHDRYFLDQVTNQILAFPERGAEIQKFSNLSQWENYRIAELEEMTRLEKVQKKQSIEKAPLPAPSSVSKKKKLSFKEQRELDGMEDEIQKVESEIAQLTQESQNPENARIPKRLLEITEALARAHEVQEKLYQRWSELSEMEK